MAQESQACNLNLPEAPFSTNSHITIAGHQHQITARGHSAAEMTHNYFSAVDTLTAAYAARNGRHVDTNALLTLVTCAIEKVRKAQDWERVSRIMKAAQLVQAGAVEQEEDGTYCVISQTHEGTAYAVSAAYQCGCEDYERHAESAEKYWCKHALACFMLEKLRAGM